MLKTTHHRKIVYVNNSAIPLVSGNSIKVTKVSDALSTIGNEFF
jgi:hypothetical protein